MFAPRRVLPAAILILLALTLAAAPPAPPSKAQIALLVNQLGDNDFDLREAASLKLWQTGEAAEEALKAAAKCDDAEISRRAGEILVKFNRGIYPDTPAKVVALLERFHAAEGNAKAEVIPEFLDEGAAGCKALLKIVKMEKDAGVSVVLVGRIDSELPRAVPLLLEANNLALLEQLVELGLNNQVRTGIGHYATFWLLSGKLDDRIAHFKAAEAKSADPEHEAEILAYLYRTKGDLPSALEAAKRADLEFLLWESAGWQRLAERKALGSEGEEYEREGLRATYYRLAGQKKELNESVEKLKKLLVDQPLEEDKQFGVAKALLLNGRTAEAIEILGTGENKLTTFELLCARNQFKEAFDLVDQARIADSKEAIALELAQARVLHLLGEKEKAATIFAKYGGMIRGINFPWYANLVEAEIKCGLTDQACAHAAKVLTDLRGPAGWELPLFAKLYLGKQKAAVLLWRLLTLLSEKEEPLVRMKRLRAFLDGKASATEVKEFLDAVEKPDVREKPLSDEAMIVADRKYDRNLMLGEVALAAKMDERAIDFFQKAEGGAGWLRVGDLLAEKKQWAKAAAAYRKSSQSDRGNPLPIWLAGWSLKHAGQEEEGKKRIEQAHWMPLGAETIRHHFALDLLKRNHHEDSRREDELILHTGELGSFYTGEATRRIALSAMMRHDYAASVTGHEKAMLRVLSPSINFVQKQAYVLVPGAIHKQHAAALLKAGKTKEALAEVRVCLDIIPGHIDLPVLLVPDLENRGMKTEADDLFEETLKLHEKLCRDYPNSPFAHNSVAWLRVCCRRDLDQALEHALKATKLAPTNAGHHDTLAEVYFQRGDQAKALAVQKKAVELEPKRTYFRKQLKRIEAGNSKAERPMEEDDEDDKDD